jgi:AraC family transcriptional regulator, regulatory protein of adaptative response / DNA-3-methyladenine glycosylase II
VCSVDPKNGPVLDFETCYRAMASRDPRFDGRFVVAVSSTGVYCRPVCPSRTPTRANTRFFRIPAAAEAAGYRACRRCRPDSAPESPEWNARGDLVARGLRMIAAGVVDEVGVSGLARRLAVSERHLHRQMVAEVGVGPQALALSRRAHLARLLVESQTLSLADVAFAAGYASVRQFNHGMRTAFGKAPRELRAAADGSCNSGPLELRLRYRPPLPVDPLLGWFGLRALPGVETVSAAVDGVEYRRTVRLPHAGGRIALRVEADHVAVQLRLGDLRDVTAAVRRCRELLDLDADPDAVAADLGQDPLLGPLVATRPGLRVPGCADGFELAVRAVLGQQVSIAAARTFGGRLVGRWGEPLPEQDGELTHLFPTPDALAGADLESIGLTRARARTIRALAEGVAEGRLCVDRHADRDEAVARLLEVPGIGPWTAGYVAMRALGDPDAFPASDLGLREAAERLGLAPAGLADTAARWCPWRSYAAVHLWASLP